MINIIKDEDLFYHIDEFDLILVGTGIHCSMAQGLQRDIMLNYPYVQERNMSTKYADKNKMGTILECKSEGQPTFVLLFICNDMHRPDIKPQYVSYESIESCLKLVNILYKGKNIATTVLGCSRFDGNGDYDTVINMMNDLCKDINLTVYDYRQLSKREKLKKIRDEELKIKKISKTAYYEAVRKRKKEADLRKENNGHARY